MTFCADQRFTADAEAKVLLASYEQEVDSILNGYFGIEEIVAANLAEHGEDGRLALAEWKKARAMMKELMMENGALFNFDDPSMPMKYGESVNTYLEHTAKTPFTNNSVWHSGNWRSVLTGARLIQKLVRLQKRPFVSKINIIERAFMPVNIFAMKIDRFGFIHDFIKKATMLTENSRRSGTKFKEMFSSAIEPFHASVTNTVLSIFSGHGYIPEKYVMDGFDIKKTDDTFVRYLGSVKDGNVIKHKVKNYETGRTEYINKDELSNQDIQNKLIDKYVNEFVNDIMHGQTRNIVWQNSIADHHQESLTWIFKKLKLKEKAAKERGNKTDQSLGISELHTVNVTDDLEITYVILKNVKKIRDKNGDVVREQPLSPDGSISTSESYNAYPIRAYDKSTGKVTLMHDGVFPMQIQELRSMKQGAFLDGFYKSESFKTFGRRIKTFVNEEGIQKFYVPKEDEEASFERGWDFSGATRMLNQPSGEILGTISSSQDSRLNTGDLWPSISRMRSVYVKVGDELAKIALEESKKLNTVVREAIKSFYGDVKIRNNPELKMFIGALEEMLNVHFSVWMSDEGAISTPNTTFRRMASNYAPIIYDKNVVRELLHDAIDSLESRIARLEESEESQEIIDNLNKKLNYYKMTLEKLYGDEEAAANYAKLAGIERRTRAKEQNVAQRNVFTKHREEWSDPAQRRKDAAVHNDYIDSLFYNLGKNNLMANMVEILTKLHKIRGSQAMDPAMLDWIMNRTKLAFSDPTAFAGVGEVDLSNQRLADFLNKLPGKRKWDAESAQRLMRGLKGLQVMFTLGHGGALINRTQIINPIINYGVDAWKEAEDILAGKSNVISREKILAVIDHLGIDEVTNLFVDFLGSGGGLSFRDAGFWDVPGVPFQIPAAALKDFLVMLRTGRQQFIEKGIPVLDGQLRKIELDRITNQQERTRLKKEFVLENLSSAKDKANVRTFLRSLENEERRLSEEKDLRSIRELRENFLDLIMLDKNNNDRKNIEKKLRAIIGDVSETRMKRMVAWKLSWFFTGLPEELFTFTGGELKMRRLTATMALLFAARTGALGAYNDAMWREGGKEVKYFNTETGLHKVVAIPHIFTTDAATRIARNAVSSSMFSMNVPNLGEAFSGIGTQLFLFKSYPLQQMLHDYNVAQTLMAGSKSITDALRRLYDASGKLLEMGIKKKKYNPADPNIDNEAMAFMRFLSTRVMASFVATMLESLSIFKALVRTPVAWEFSSMVRGAENAFIGLPIRLAFNLIFLASADDDLFEGGGFDVGFDIARLLLPVFVTLPLYFMMSFFD